MKILRKNVIIVIGALALMLLVGISLVAAWRPLIGPQTH